MFIVLLNLILSSIALIIIVGTTLILTAVAIGLIIGSLVRASKAKKNNRKTHKAGMWIGITMLIIPWLIVVFAVGAAYIIDKVDNRWTFDKEVVAEAVADEDAEALYELMAPEMLDSNDLTEGDLEDFFNESDIENNSRHDMERYTAYESLGDASDPEGNHYRPDGQFFDYTMYYVNDDGGRIFMSGVLYDSENADNVGIWYIEYLSRDPETGDEQTVAEFGERPD